MKLLLASLLVLFLLFGCTQSNSGSGLVGIKETQNVPMVETGDTIQVEYVGTLESGEQFDSSQGKEPLEFIVGSGQLIEGFDSGVVGMKLNDEKTVKIPPEKAYGMINNELIQDVPLSVLADANIAVEPGMELVAGGRLVKVVSVNDENAVIDFNHPLAGKTLNFWIKVVKITKASVQT